MNYVRRGSAIVLVPMGKTDYILLNPKVVKSLPPPGAICPAIYRSCSSLKRVQGERGQKNRWVGYKNREKGHLTCLANPVCPPLEYPYQPINDLSLNSGRYRTYIVIPGHTVTLQSRRAM